MTPADPIDLTGVLGPSPGYAYVARATGTLVYTAGAVPVDRDGNLVGAEDVVRQTGAALANLQVALEAAGSTPDDVVKTTLYVVGDQASLLTVWDVFAKSDYVRAPSTLVGVTQLGYRGQLVEIEAVAVVA